MSLLGYGLGWVLCNVTALILNEAERPLILGGIAAFWSGLNAGWKIRT